MRERWSCGPAATLVAPALGTVGFQRFASAAASGTLPDFASNISFCLAIHRKVQVRFRVVALPSLHGFSATVSVVARERSSAVVSTSLLDNNYL
jgi:uncharacterized membrane protein YfcA